MSGRLVQRLGHVVGIFPVDRLQMQSNPGMKCQSTEKFLGQAGIVFPNAFLRKSPVSYTHLDVYKRQILLIDADAADIGCGYLQRVVHDHQIRLFSYGNAANPIGKPQGPGGIPRSRLHRVFQRNSPLDQIPYTCLLYTSRCV